MAKPKASKRREKSPRFGTGSDRDPKKRREHAPGSSGAQPATREERDKAEPDERMPPDHQQSARTRGLTPDQEVEARGRGNSPAVNPTPPDMPDAADTRDAHDLPEEGS